MTPSEERADRADIAEVLIRYASGIDTRDWDLFRSCFAEACSLDYPGIGAWESAASITEFMREAHAGMGHTLHRITNIAVTVQGDTARARSSVDGILMATDGQSGLNPIGFYEDELARIDGEWRITQRRYTTVHFRTVGPS